VRREERKKEEVILPIIGEKRGEEEREVRVMEMYCITYINR
jgi:hypothetical protein